MVSRAVFYICGGYKTKYFFEAIQSAQSVKKHLGLPCFLFIPSNVRYGNARVFDAVVRLPARQTGLWFLDSTHYFVQAVDRLMEYEQLMYLDTDTYICDSCLDMFDVLDRYDFAICQSPQRDAIPTVSNTPPSFTTLEIGSQVFRNSPQVRNFLAKWLAKYQDNRAAYGDTDQAALRDVLWESSDIRWLALPPEYGFRYQFGGLVNGKVRILHGHAPRSQGESKSLSSICTQLNASGTLRLWPGG